MFYSSATGVFFLADKTERDLPKGPKDPKTHEVVHRSVLEQEGLSPAITELLANYPTIVCPLTELEEQIKKNWRYDPSSPQVQKYAAEVKKQKVTGASAVAAGRPTSWLKTLVRSVSRMARVPRVKVAEEVTTSEDGASTTVGVVAKATVSKRLSQLGRPKAA
jgi:hypothetical protein